MTKIQIADVITRLIVDLSIHSNKIAELEKRVDATHDNLFTDFRSGLPNLNEADYHLFLFSTLQFSNDITAKFLKR